VSATTSPEHGIARSPLGFHVGRGKMLFAVAVERGWRRTPDILYFGARTIEDLRANLVATVLTSLPKGSRVVGVAPAIGHFHDERGDLLEAG